LSFAHEWNEGNEFLGRVGSGWWWRVEHSAIAESTFEK
jgi:hypothetical protein